jgi:D-alanyl-D-alanine carboxypeptidase-like protein
MPDTDSRSLLQRQERFTEYVAHLINVAYSRGWTLTFSDTYRDPAYHPLAKLKSGALSCHAVRLAVDFNLRLNAGDKDVVTGEHSAWATLGAFWKSLDPLCRWGGDFPGDSNHFSLTYNGVS